MHASLWDAKEASIFKLRSIVSFLVGEQCHGRLMHSEEQLVDWPNHLFLSPRVQLYTRAPRDLF